MDIIARLNSSSTTVGERVIIGCRWRPSDARISRRPATSGCAGTVEAGLGRARVRIAPRRRAGRASCGPRSATLRPHAWRRSLAALDRVRRARAGGLAPAAPRDGAPVRYGRATRALSSTRTTRSGECRRRRWRARGREFLGALPGVGLRAPRGVRRRRPPATPPWCPFRRRGQSARSARRAGRARTPAGIRIERG